MFVFDVFSGTLQRSLVFDVHPHHVQPVLVSGHPTEYVQIYGGGGVAAGGNDLSCACMTQTKNGMMVERESAGILDCCYVDFCIVAQQ